MAEQDRERFDRASVRWLARLALDRRLDVEDLRSGLAGVRASAPPPAQGEAVLAELLRRPRAPSAGVEPALTQTPGAAQAVPAALAEARPRPDRVLRAVPPGAMFRRTSGDLPAAGEGAEAASRPARGLRGYRATAGAATLGEAGGAARARRSRRSAPRRGAGPREPAHGRAVRRRDAALVLAGRVGGGLADRRTPGSTRRAPTPR
jgi:hypothetical protein